MALLRYQLFGSYAIVFGAIWYQTLSFRGLIPATSSWKIDHWYQTALSSSLIDRIIIGAPLWFVLYLALYSVASITHGVMTFRDCPEAKAELDDQIKEARVEMTKRGIL
jgi:hypothetical protein